MTLVPMEGKSTHSQRLPAQVELILSAMEAGGNHAIERRKTYRLPYRAVARLKLFSDQPDDEPWTLYTRNVDSRGMGFITPRRMPLGYGGVVELLAPNGEWVRVHCTIFRCRETVAGWYEAALYFNTEQFAFQPPVRASAKQSP